MQDKPIYVLLADDDEDDRMIFSQAFEVLKLKSRVKTVNDGMELMELLADQRNSLPNILFLDLNMPRKSGMECLMEIKRIDYLKDVAIAIYSTSASEEDIEDTFVKGANVYIKKPSDFATLKKLLNEVMNMNWQYQTSGLNKENFLLNR